jgi:hypothetical protein
MPSKFLGSYQELKDRLLLVGLGGEWREQPNGIRRFVCADGAGLNWSETNGTLWFDGAPLAKAILEARVKAAFVNERPCDDATVVFVVHGCGKDARQQLETAFRRLGLEPEVLEFVPF